MIRARDGVIRKLFAVAARAPNLSQAILGSSDTAEWPDGAIHDLQMAKLLRPAAPSAEVLCRGCEEHCLRPVYLIDHDGKPAVDAVSTCDLFGDLGPYFHPEAALARWTTSRKAIAEFLRRHCMLEIADVGEQWRRVRFRRVGREDVTRTVSLQFDPLPKVHIGTARVPLISMMIWDDVGVRIDAQFFSECIALSDELQSGNKPYQPSLTVREENKLLTQIRDRRLQRQFDELARRNPKLNKEQLARRLVTRGELSNMTVATAMRVVRMPVHFRKK